MPPQGQNGQREKTTAFGRAHPNLQKMLLLASQATSPLILLAVLWQTGAVKRPQKEKFALWRAALWRAALWSYLSRFVLIGCSVTWTLNGWGDEDEDDGNE